MIKIGRTSKQIIVFCLGCFGIVTCNESAHTAHNMNDIPMFTLAILYAEKDLYFGHAMSVITWNVGVLAAFSI